MPESRCTGCGLLFTSLSAFDAHQRAVGFRPFSVCRDPRTLKRPLEAKVRERAGKRRTVWGWPSDAGRFA